MYILWPPYTVQYVEIVHLAIKGTFSQLKNISLKNLIKGKVSRDFRHFFLSKNSTWAPCWRSQQLRGHRQVSADTFWKLWRLLTDFKGIFRRKKVIGCVYKPNSNNLKIWKCLYLTKNVHVRVIVDYADTHFRALRSNNFTKTKKFAKFFACSFGPMGRIF